jgi:hypothetical protein
MLYTGQNQPVGHIPVSPPVAPLEYPPLRWSANRGKQTLEQAFHAAYLDSKPVVVKDIVGRVCVTHCLDQRCENGAPLRLCAVGHVRLREQMAPLQAQHNGGFAALAKRERREIAPVATQAPVTGPREPFGVRGRRSPQRGQDIASARIEAPSFADRRALRNIVSEETQTVGSRRAALEVLVKLRQAAQTTSQGCRAAGQTG